MTKSILQTKKECYLCHTTQDLHLHHVYGGGNRKVSDREGFTVWLCAKHHNMSGFSVHFNKAMDYYLKAECQAQYEKTHSRAEFMALIGKNYRGEQL